MPPPPAPHPPPGYGQQQQAYPIPSGQNGVPQNVTYIVEAPKPKIPLILYCPCCKIPWDSYRDLSEHCRGRSFDSFIRCGQPSCMRSFFKDQLNKYLEHLQVDHIRPHELGIPEPEPVDVPWYMALIGLVIFFAIAGAVFYFFIYPKITNK